MADFADTTPVCESKGAALLAHADLRSFSIADLAALDRYAAHMAGFAEAELRAAAAADVADAFYYGLCDMKEAACDLRDRLAAEMRQRAPQAGERRDWLGVVVGNLLLNESPEVDVANAALYCAAIKAA